MRIAETSRYLSQVNIESSRARLLQHSEPAKVTITREEGGLTIESEPIRLDIDNRGFFDSMGLKSISSLADDLIARSKKAALEGMARYAQEGDMLADPHGEHAISQVAIMRTQKSIETMLVFMPENPPEMHWTGGTVDITYTPDRLNFAWDIQDIETTYIPYSVKFSVEE